MLETNGSPIYMTGNDGFGFGGGLGGILAILIIAMMFMGGGGLFGGNAATNDATAAALGAMAANNNNYRPQYATQDFVQNGFNFNDLQDQNRDILGAITNGTAQSVAASNQVYHNLADLVSDKYSEITRDIGALAVSQAQALANQNQCCCETKMTLADGFAQTNANIAQNRYENALNTAAIQKTIVEEAQKNRDILAGNRIADMQNQINQLQLAQAVSGVVRYPMGSTYTAGPGPFFNVPYGFPA